MNNRQTPDKKLRFRGVPIISLLLLSLLSVIAAVLSAHSEVNLTTVLLPAAGAGIFSFLLYVTGSVLPLVLVVPVLAASWFITGSLTGMLFSLLFLPLMLAVLPVQAGKTEFHFSSAVAAAVTAVFFLILSLSGILTRFGTISLATIKEAMAEPLDALRSYLTSLSTKHDGETYTVYTAQQAEAFVNYLIGILPAVIGMTAILMSWLSAAVFRLLLRFMRLPDEKSRWRFRMPLSAALLFLGAYLLWQIFEWTELSTGSLAAVNVYLLFLPYFLVTGATLLVRLFRMETGRKYAVIFTVILLLLLLLSPTSGIFWLSFIGAGESIFRYARHKIRRNPE